MTDHAVQERTPPSLLVVSNMYPSPGNPMFGAFIAKQEAALGALGVRVRMVANTRWRNGALRNAIKYGSLLLRTVVASMRGGFDVVVGHFLYPTAWFARIAARIARKPYVLVVHGTDVRSVQRDDAVAARCRDALRHASLVVCVSDALEERLRGEVGLPEGLPVAVVNMGVDRSVFRPVPDARETLGIAPDARVVLFAGNLVASKNVEALLEAFDSLRESGDADLLLVAGADPEGRRASLEALAADRAPAGAVEFLGPLPAQRLAAAMTAADVFVLPSLAEALGIVLLESMACGTPVVASRVGGIPEIVSEGCGRLVEPGDPAALAAAIADVIRRGKNEFAECCAETAAANDVIENARRFVREISAHARGSAG